MLRTAITHVLFSAMFARGFHFDTPKPEDAPAVPADPFTAMREEFSRLQGEAGALLDLAVKENRELKDEEKQANEKRFNRMKQIKATLDDKVKFAALALEGGAAGVTVTKPGDAPGREEFEKSKQPTAITVIDKSNRDQFATAMNRWASTGDMDRKFATITTATSTSAMLPRVIGEPIVPTSANVLREALAIHGQMPVTTGTTADLKIPVLTASAGGVVAQDASAETENAPSLSETIVLNVSTYQSGSAWFSNQQLNATDFDLVTYVQQDLSYAKELGLESAAIAAMIADAGITQSVPAATISGITYDNLVDLNRKLPKRFDRMKVIILSSTAYAAAEKLVGDDGHPVLNRDPQNQELLRFNGTPVLRCDYLEAFGANKVIGLCISLIGFRLRDASRLELHRYTQSPARPAQTGFNLIGYHGYGYAASSVAKLKCPAE